MFSLPIFIPKGAVLYATKRRKTLKISTTPSKGKHNKLYTCKKVILFCVNVAAIFSAFPSSGFNFHTFCITYLKRQFVIFSVAKNRKERHDLAAAVKQSSFVASKKCGCNLYFTIFIRCWNFKIDIHSLTATFEFDYNSIKTYENGMGAIRRISGTSQRCYFI